MSLARATGRRRVRDLAFIGFLAALFGLGLKRPFLFVLCYVYIDIGADEPLIVRQDGTTGHQPGETLGISPTGTLHRFDAAGKPMAA